MRVIAKAEIPADRDSRFGEPAGLFVAADTQGSRPERQVVLTAVHGVYTYAPRMFVVHDGADGRRGRTLWRMRVGPEVTGKRVTWLARRATVPSGVYWIVWIHWIVWSLYVRIAGIRVRSDNGSQNVDR